MAKELYYEQQKFPQFLLWLIIGVGALPMAGVLGRGVYLQLILGQPWGDEPMSDLGLILVTVLCYTIIIGVILLFRYATLESNVTRWSVRYKFYPLIPRWKELVKSDIKEYKIVHYSFRGYGVRWGLDGIKTLNVRGNKGIEFIYGDNKKIIIGTQHPDLFLAALDKMKNPELE